ncbi:MAG: hypothetical protein ACKO2G_10585 [Verrucomicrobiales bacterium]
MKHRPSLFLAALAALTPAISIAGTQPAPAAPAEPPISDWEKFNNWNIGGVLFPNVHMHGIGGWSTDEPEDLATGGHDPRREAFSAQAIEPGISLRTKYLEGFVNGIFFQDGEGEWDSELEEAFGKITNLPGGFEIKGGQFLSRFGIQNATHLHAWDFVDSEIVNSRFLGEHGILLRGAEVSWTLPLGTDPGFVSIASVGYGEARPHEHDHDHGGHDHEHEEEAPFEGEEATLDQNIWTARLMGRYRPSDFHQFTGGVSWAGGDNSFGRSTDVAGVDFEYLWRENGLEAGGRALRWRNEVLWRRVGAFSSGEHDHGHEEEHHDHDEEDHGHEEDHHDHGEEDHGSESMSGTYEELGLYSTLVYTWNPRLDTGLRVGWVEGIEDFGEDERLRISPNISYWFDDGRRIGARVQYNYDNISGAEDEHSVWFQLNIALGSINEVR